MDRRQIIAAAALAPLAARASRAQSGPLRFVFPFAAGGAGDGLTRIVADAVGRALNEATVVEARPGAGGQIGTQAVIGAPADGRYRLLHAPGGGIVVAPGAPAQGAGLALPLQPVAGPLPVDLQLRHRHLGDGVRLALAPADATPARLQALHRGQLLLVQEDAAGRVLQATGVQAAAALDALYAPAEALTDLGVTLTRHATRFRLWAPTAQAVHLCLHASDTAPAQPAVHALQRDDATGSWQLQLPGLPPARYARYLMDVWVPGTGLVRQRVTDPYAVSLGTDGRHTLSLIHI